MRLGKKKKKKKKEKKKKKKKKKMETSMNTRRRVMNATRNVRCINSVQVLLIWT
jgi:hypothetical protein